MTQTETAMGAALRRAGLHARDIALDRALALYRNHGGTEDGALLRVRLAFANAMPANGQMRSVRDDQVPNANGGHPKGDGKDLCQGADKAAGPLSDPSPSVAGRVLGKLPKQRYAPPRKPLPREAVRAAARLDAAAVFKIDGADIRTLTLGRCRTLLAHNRTENYVLSVIVARLKHLPDSTVVGKMINDDELSSIARQGKEFGHAA